MLKVSFCDRSMSVVRCQQFAFEAYSAYIPMPTDLKISRKHQGDLCRVAAVKSLPVHHHSAGYILLAHLSKAQGELL